MRVTYPLTAKKFGGPIVTVEVDERYFHGEKKSAKASILTAMAAMRRK